MITKQMKVTPEMAMEWVDRHEGLSAPQRHSYNLKVRQYASDMKAGRWEETHQGIAIGKNGAILDGLHRLKAVVIAGVPVDMLVSTDVKQGAMDAIDTGRGRDVATVLTISHGVSNGRTIASAVRAILTVGNRQLTNVISAPQVLQCMDLIGDEIDKTVHSLGVKRPLSYITGPIAFYMATKPRKAIEFAESYRDMAELAKGHPVLHLKKQIEIMRKRYHEVFRLTQTVCQALHRYDENVITPEPLEPSEEDWKWLMNTNPTLMSKLLKITS